MEPVTLSMGVLSTRAFITTAPLLCGYHAALNLLTITNCCLQMIEFLHDFILQSIPIFNAVGCRWKHFNEVQIDLLKYF